MKNIVCILACLCFSSSAFSEEKFPEPFGLTWGMSEVNLEKHGFTLASDSDGLKIFSSVSAPKAWSKADMYVAITYKGKLVKAAASSTEFKDDIYGTEGKNTYGQIKDILSKKYGNPTNEYERVGGKLYDDADEFYQCLEYAGCGTYLSMYEVKGGMIAIQLKGKRRGEGYLSISYESPEFYIAKKEIESGEIKSDADAL